MSKESFREFSDRVCYVILKAPNRFPSDTKMNLERAFVELMRGFDASKEEFGAQSDNVAQLIENSLAAYRVGDIKSGIKNLQEIDNIVRNVTTGR